MSQTFKQIFVDGPITPDQIARSIQQHQTKYDIGGHNIFLGQVRADQKTEGYVRAIEFTAFEEMALSKAHSIREDIFTKYPLTCMHIYHSLGEVLAGEICLFVFTSSAHRRAAIDACDELVNRIKTELPIWGKEILADGKTIWKENR
jgi:molybdopterin synthase catalytic subunit